MIVLWGSLWVRAPSPAWSLYTGANEGVIRKKIKVNKAKEARQMKYGS